MSCTTVPASNAYYSNYCAFRLPCGLCKETNSYCPTAGYSGPAVTWASGVGTGTPVTTKEVTISGSTSGYVTVDPAKGGTVSA